MKVASTNFCQNLPWPQKQTQSWPNCNGNGKEQVERNTLYRRSTLFLFLCNKYEVIKEMGLHQPCHFKECFYKAFTCAKTLFNFAEEYPTIMVGNKLAKARWLFKKRSWKWHARAFEWTVRNVTALFVSGLFVPNKWFLYLFDFLLVFIYSRVHSPRPFYGVLSEVHV